jgi:hypothetical protein
LDFKSKDGSVFKFCFTTGEVINVNSWTENGERHHGVWIRNLDGREWYRKGLPFQVNMTRGQYVAFAWGAAPGSDTNTLVAVHNCSTGARGVLSDAMAISLSVNHLGRGTFCVLTALMAVLHATNCFLAFPDWMPHISLEETIFTVLSASLLGCLVGCIQDADPDRVIDRSVSLALYAIQYGYDRTRPSTNRKAAS